MRERTVRVNAWKSLVLAVLLALAPAGRAWAVAVSPSALFLDLRSPAGTLTLYNGGTLPEELEVSFAFGYPMTDAEGTVRVEMVDTAPAGEPSIVPWMRAFPRRLVLQPGQRQTLRVMVQPPADLPPGEHWGRVLVRARGGQPPIEQQEGGVRMQINVETVIATAVLFRKGEVSTGVAVTGAAAAPAEGGVRVSMDLARQGNAAFLGRVVTELVAPDGRVVAEREDAVSVYRTLRHAAVLPLPAGTSAAGYTVRYRADTDRPDLPPGALTAGAVTGSVPVS
jgi:P pilus assembly chaperone PapD